MVTCRQTLCWESWEVYIWTSRQQKVKDIEPRLRIQNSKANLQWHTSSNNEWHIYSNKVVSLHPCQIAPLPNDQALKYKSLYGGIPIHHRWGREIIQITSDHMTNGKGNTFYGFQIVSTKQWQISHLLVRDGQRCANSGTVCLLIPHFNNWILGLVIWLSWLKFLS